MAIPFAAIGAGMSFASSIFSFFGSRQQAKAQKQWQKYRNTMTMLSNAQQQNNITQNEIFALEASAQEQHNVRTNEILGISQAVAQAAAFGVKGNSVNATLFDLNRSAEQASYNVQTHMKNARIGFQAQRENAAMAAAMQQDHSFIPKPSFLGAVINGTLGAMNTYNSFQRGPNG